MISFLKKKLNKSYFVKKSQRFWLKKIFSLLFIALFLAFPFFSFGGIFNFARDSIVGGMTWMLERIFGASMMFLGLAVWCLDLMLSSKMYDEVFFSDVAIGGINAGWSLVRDFVNMFFILILVFIAISTILGVGSFSDKKKLFSLITAAVLVNFSKAIAVFIMDVSQLAMNFFMNSISSEANSFGAMLAGSAGMNSMSADSNFSNDDTKMMVILMQIVFSFVFACILMGVAAALVVRMVAFWILIILSPLAFFAMSLPGTALGRIKDQWFSKIISWAAFGPVLLFFLWLSFVLINAILVATNNSPGFQQAKAQLNIDEPSTMLNFATGATGAFLPFVSAIYFIFYGLDVAKSTASAAGGAATKMLDKGLSSATFRGGSSARKLAGMAGRGAKVTAGGIAGATGVTAYSRALKENTTNSLESSKYGKWMTKKGRQGIQEERIAKYKAGKGAIMPIKDDSALNSLYRDQSLEVTKKIKEQGISTEDMSRKMSDPQGKLKPAEKIAYARELAKRGKFKDEQGGDLYGKMMESLKGQSAFAEEITREARKENLSSVMNYEIERAVDNEGPQAHKFEGKLKNYLAQGLNKDEATNKAKNDLKEDLWTEQLKKMKNLSDFSKQGEGFYEEKNSNGESFALKKLQEMKQQVGVRKMRNVADNMDDARVLQIWKKAGLLDEDVSSEDYVADNNQGNDSGNDRRGDNQGGDSGSRGGNPGGNRGGNDSGNDRRGDSRRGGVNNSDPERNPDRPMTEAERRLREDQERMESAGAANEERMRRERERNERRIIEENERNADGADEGRSPDLNDQDNENH